MICKTSCVLSKPINTNKQREQATILLNRRQIDSGVISYCDHLIKAFILTHRDDPTPLLFYEIYTNSHGATAYCQKCSPH